MSAYVYTPLQPERNQIRLVMLMPHSSSGERNIEIEIFNTDADSAPDYEALSYVWGSPDRTANEVLIPRDAMDDPFESVFGTFSHHQTGWRLGITRNLWIALKYLRSPHVTRVLWIDSISINQEDVEERSREVLKMGSIYRQAQRVVIWLGEESHDTYLAIDALKSIGEGTTWFRADDGVTIITTRSDSYAFLLENDARAKRAKVVSWIAIRRLLKATWFTRLWTFQELLLASDAIFVIGFQTIGLPILSQALDWINSQVKFNNDSSSINTIFDRRSIGAIQIAMHYNMGLQSLCASQLFPLRESANIIPDYTKSTEQVYLEACLNNFETTGSLRLLGRCDSAESNSTLKLPSWVPDLSIQRLARNTQWAASGTSEAFYLHHVSSKSLQIRGKIACSIKEVASPISLGAGLPEILAVCHTWESAAGSPKKPYIGSKCRLIDAFISTLFLGSLVNIADLKSLRRLFTAEALAEAYKTLIVDGTMSNNYYMENLADRLPGRTFFSTDEGYIGLCPASVRPGDKIFIALGAENPLLVRPVSEEGDRYEACGECFVLGLMDGEGILGALPPGWAACSESVMQQGLMTLMRVFRAPDQSSTQSDPRLPRLASPWSVFFGSPSDRHQEEVRMDGTLRKAYFQNGRTGDTTGRDPRLTSQALRDRGIEIQDIFLV